MYGRSFGTASGDYIVPEKYGGTVYKRPAEKAEKPAQAEPRVTPVSGGLRLSQMAAEMHEKDLKRITGESSDDAAPEETATEAVGEKPDDASKAQGKKRFPDISEEDLLVIALIMLMLGGSQQGEAKRELEQKSPEAEETVPEQAQEKTSSMSSAGDDVLIPLLLTLLIW